jgi:branched-chain amino acid transport system substrate-binding protein
MIRKVVPWLLTLLFLFVTLPLATEIYSQENVITIGCSISLSGKLVKEGKLTKDGYDLWVKLVNERGGLNVGGKRYNVKIKYYDDESNVQTSTKLVEKLITEDKLGLLLGPYGSGPSFATSAISEKYRKVMVIPMAASSDVYERGFKYMFGVLATTDEYMVDIIRLAGKQDPKPKAVAMLWKNDLANKSLAEPIPALCKEIGAELVYNEKFSPEATDFASELAGIKAKKPDILIFFSQLPQFIMAMKQIKEMKIDAKMVTNGIAVPQPDFVKSLGKDAEYAVGPSHWEPNSRYGDDLFKDSPDYVKKFQEMHGYIPDYHASGGTAGVQILGKAIEKAGSTDPEKVREALANFNETTFWGPIKFDKTGKITGRSMVVGQIQGGEFVPVYPEAVAAGKLIWPAPAWEKR